MKKKEFRNEGTCLRDENHLHKCIIQLFPPQDSAQYMGAQRIRSQGKDGKMRGKVKEKVIYVLDSNNIISDFIQGKREDEDGDEELMSEGACLRG